MNYEERYKQALERAREELGSGCFDRGTVEYIFPELKESEDERIRKELIEQVIYIVPDKNEVDDNGNTLPCYTTRIKKYIAWLEKQGEKLPVGFYYVNSEGKKFYSDTFKYGDMILHVEKQGEQKHV